MGRCIKVIQNGNITILPNNQKVINRLESFNVANRNSKAYAELLYTIVHDVTPEEEATVYPPRSKKNTSTTPSAIDRLAAMEKENSELKSLMLKFMVQHGMAEDEGLRQKAKEDPIHEEKRKAGRPPKTD